MSDKVFVGQHVSDLDIGEKPARISRVTIVVDSDHQYTTGDDTGRTLEKSVPWGSQAMADAILAAVKNYDYQPFTGTDAILNPAAEIGDGITVGGVYSILAQKDASFGKLTTTGISAPVSDEINDEYPYISKAQRQANRQLAQTRSTITKTADEIRAEVQSEISGLSSSIDVKLESITSEVNGLNGQFSRLTQTVEGFTFEGPGGVTMVKGSSIETGSIAAGAIKASQVQLSGAITWGDFANGIEDYINEAHRNASSAAREAQDAKEIAQLLADGDYSGGTFIDGTSLYSPEIYTNEFNIYADGSEYGYLNLYGRYGGRNRNVFDIYYDAGGPTVRFESDLAAEATFDFSYMYFLGRVAFDDDVEFHGDVTGVNSLSLFQENSGEAAQGDSPMEGPSIEGEQPQKKERPSVKLSDDNGSLRVELPSGKVWYLDDAGLHE